jgi:hypothetical protein
MNRIVVFGLALFFALVGIALVGGENKASAFIFGGGYGGGGCNGCGGCHGGHHRCHGGHRCNGGHHRCHGRHRCHGGCNGGGCNGGGCCGGAGYVQAPGGYEKQAPAPAQVPMQAPVK